MAVRRTNSAEGGTHGGVVGSGSTTGGASGDIFSSNSGAGTGVCEFSNVWAAHGSLSYQIVFTTAAEAKYLQWSEPGEPGPFAARWYQRWTALPDAEQFVAQIRNSSAGTMATVSITAAGMLKIINRLGAGAITGTVAMPSAPTGAGVRIEIHEIAHGTTTTDGVIEVAWYLGDSTTPQETLSSSTYDTGTVAPQYLRLGRASSQSAAWTTWYDDIALQTGATAPIGEYGANVPPVVTAGAPIVVPGTGSAQTVGLTSLASDDGSIVAREWTCILVRSSGATVPPTIATPTTADTDVTLTHPGRYDFQIEVEDDDGALATAVQTVYVTTATARPSGMVANPGAWANIGSASSIESALADSSDATLARSPGTPSSPATIRLHLDPMPILGSLTLQLRDKLQAAGTGTPVVTLYEGAVARKSWTLSAPGTSASTRSLSMSSVEAATVTSWLDLTLELSWS